MRSTFLLAFFLSCLVPVTAFAELYRCKIDGKLKFQDRPCAKTAEASTIVVSPASGITQSPPPSPRPGTPLPSVNTQVAPKSEVPGSDTAAWLRDRERLDIEKQIDKLERENEQARKNMDREIARLQRKKGYANNNLAGATWEQSISAEMSAVAAKYDSQINTNERRIDRLRSQLDRMDD